MFDVVKDVVVFVVVSNFIIIMIGIYFMLFLLLFFMIWVYGVFELIFGCRCDKDLYVLEFVVVVLVFVVVY